MTWNKCKCTHNNINITCKVMKKTWKYEYKRKEQTNITDRVVWFRLLFQFIRCCLIIIKIADMWFISLLTVWFGLLQVCFVASLFCCKFVAKLLQVWILKLKQTPHPTETIPYSIFGFIGWLIDRIYNKQQYNDQSVNCCKQPTPTPTQTKTPTISYPYPYPYLIIAYSI